MKAGRGGSSALLPPDPTSPPTVTGHREGVEELFAGESGLLGEGGRRAWALNRVKSTVWGVLLPVGLTKGPLVWN